MAQVAPIDTPQLKQGEEFEFNDSHNLVFDGLARWMKLAGVVEIGLGAVYLLPAIMNLMVLNTPPVVVALLHIVVMTTMGLWTIKAGGSIREIVDTEGDDIRHLMDGLGSLKRLFLLQGVVFLLLIALAVIGFFSGGLSATPKFH
jgi:hypothetical protein